NAGTQYLTFSVNLSNPTDVPVTVSYATADGSATTADHDYGAVSDRQSVASGTTGVRRVSGTVYSKNRHAPDEAFTPPQSGASDATLQTAQATGTIINDDVALSVSDASFQEGNSGVQSLTFSVLLSGPTSGPVTVSYATADGSATTADHDYGAV